MIAQAFNEDKFKELILYIASRSECDPTFGAIKLNKTLFFADFFAYAHFGKSITGAEYIKLDHGPGPKLMAPIRDRMMEDNDIVVVSREHFGYPQKRVVARRPPDLSEFTANEIALVDTVIDIGKDANAAELSALTHQMLGWQIAAYKAVIPYEAVFLSSESATAGDEQRAEELAVQYQW